MPVIPMPTNQKTLAELIFDQDQTGEAPVDLGEIDTMAPPAAEPSLDDHYANLAGLIDPDVIKEQVRDVMNLVADDVDAHQRVITSYAEILKHLGFDRSEDRQSAPMEGSSGVVSPTLAKTATDLSARIMAQLRPANGPTRVAVVGMTTPQKELKAKRVKEYLDLQQSQLIKGYRRQEDLMMVHLPYVGTCFKKIFWNGNEIQSEYVRVEDLVIPYHTESLEQAERICHIIKMSRHEFEHLQNVGFYLDEPLPPPTTPNQIETDRVHDRIQGLQPNETDEGLYEFYEVHCLLDFSDIDGGGPYPYVVTYDSDTQVILRISRNWDVDDTTHTRDEVFIDYVMTPWRGVYGLGLHHQIGGLAKTATDALRALLDAAKLHNSPMGFRLKAPSIGGTSGNELRLAPFEYAEIDASGTQARSINDVIMNVPFNGPDATLFQLLQYVVEEAGSFANINTQLIADSSNTGPVGTTYALIEESAKVFNSIFARIHESKRRELQIIHRLNYRHLDDHQTVLRFGGELIVSKTDFNGDCDVFPVSDPNVSSNAQKIAQLQAVMMMAQQMPPGLINMQKLAQRAFIIMGMTDFEDLLTPVPPPPMPRDPVGNIQAILSGLPVDAFPDQDADAHIAVYTEILQDPLYGANPLMGAVLNPPLLKLIAAFLKFRLGKMWGHVISGNPQQAAPLGLAAPPNPNPMAAAQLANAMARESGYVLHADQMLAEKLGPIIQAAMAFIPPPPVDPLSMSAQAEKDSVQAKHQADIMSIVTKAADIQSRERIAEMNANQATDRAIIQALGVAQPPTPTAFTPEGQLPQNIPDPIQQIATELYALMQKLGGGSGSSAAAAPPQPSGPMPPQPPLPSQAGPGNLVQSVLHPRPPGT